MATRAIWKGDLSFGLVSIPVELVPAEDRAEKLSFTMLDQRNMAKIGYERINKETREPVPWEEVVKGYEVEKGDFVVLNDSDFERANIEATHTIDIVQFIDQDELDFAYFDKPYYLRPTKKGLKAYALLRDTLRGEAKVAIARVVIRTRQHVALVVPRSDVMMLEILRYPEELRSEEDIDLPDMKKAHPTQAERTMAKQLVEGMTRPLDLSEFRDDYRDDVMRIINEKVERGEINQVTEPEEVERPKTREREVDLMAMLKRSLEEKPAAASKKKPAHKKKKRAKASTTKKRAVKARTRKSA